MTRFLFYGGKGGVGKTTCAAARAIREAASGSRTLVVSTDPAHSLGDALDRKLSTRPRAAARRLDAVELDAPRAFVRWLDEHRAALSDAVEHGTWLSRADVDLLLDLPVPGVDELVGLLEIARLSRSYDVIVVDTAPTGHALRLIDAPAAVRAVADALDSLQEEHRVIRDQLTRMARADAADRVIELIAEQSTETAAMLRDAQRTTFHWVTLAECLSIAESEDGVAALSRAGISVGDIVVNRLLPDAPSCPLCDPRRAEERRMLDRIRRSLVKGRELRVVPALPKEPRGVHALSAIAEHLLRAPTVPALRPRSTSNRKAANRRPMLSTIAADSVDAIRGAALIFVGGKGGVGKTTVAAAVALRLATTAPSRSVLLLSTDPAHSLADVLDSPLNDQPSRLRHGPPNLRAREVDAVHTFEQKRRALREALDEIAPTRAAASRLSSDGGLDQLLSLAPPGVDELFGMLSILDARAGHDTVVVDTAPTGHALRLLEMPEVAREWVQVLLRLLLKYREIARPGRLAAELVAASQSIRDVQAALVDHERTRFVIVTRAAALPRAETVRLRRRLASLSMPTAALVVNARTLEPGACRWCRTTAAAEGRELAALARMRGCAIIQTPLVAPPPRGAAALNFWAQTWVPLRS